MEKYFDNAFTKNKVNAMGNLIESDIE